VQPHIGVDRGRGALTFGYGGKGQLGHGGEQIASVPRRVQAWLERRWLVHRQVSSTQQFGPAGGLFTFGSGYHGMLGHGGEQGELPRLVETAVNN